MKKYSKQSQAKAQRFMPQWARTNKVLDGKYTVYLQKLTWQYVQYYLHSFPCYTKYFLA